MSSSFPLALSVCFSLLRSLYCTRKHSPTESCCDNKSEFLLWVSTLENTSRNSMNEMNHWVGYKSGQSWKTTDRLLVAYAAHEILTKSDEKKTTKMKISNQNKCVLGVCMYSYCVHVTRLKAFAVRAPAHVYTFDFPKNTQTHAFFFADMRLRFVYAVCSERVCVWVRFESMNSKHRAEHIKRAHTHTSYILNEIINGNAARENGK